MRRIAENRPLTKALIDHDRAREFDEISKLLDQIPRLRELVRKDLLAGVANPNTGREGMSADQVLRCMVLKQKESFSYDELTFHIADSDTYRRFCRFVAWGKTPKKATLNENIKKVSAETMELVHRAIVGFAQSEGIENCEVSRVDCTPVPTDILEPSDSSLLWDCVRVMSRLLVQTKDLYADFSFRDRSRTGKSTAYKIQFDKKPAQRKLLYKKLLMVTRKTVAHAVDAVKTLSSIRFPDPTDQLRAELLIDELRMLMGQTELVMEQTFRRVMKEEKVAAQDKVFSIFEPHTDIIVKGSRDTEYGHKICLSGGRSGLILDCIIPEGNPADSTLARQMIERHIVIYGKPPKQVAFDGGFASKANLEDIKALGVKDVAFHKKRELKVSDMVKSSWVYKRLIRFRAGVEAVISFLKRCFGLDRCRWKGLLSYRSYVWSSVVSYNLLTLARHRLANATAEVEAAA